MASRRPSFTSGSAGAKPPTSASALAHGSAGAEAPALAPASAPAERRLNWEHLYYLNKWKKYVESHLDYYRDTSISKTIFDFFNVRNIDDLYNILTNIIHFRDGYINDEIEYFLNHIGNYKIFYGTKTNSVNSINASGKITRQVEKYVGFSIYELSPKLKIAFGAKAYAI